jgi:hypothetical protein
VTDDSPHSRQMADLLREASERLAMAQLEAQFQKAVHEFCKLADLFKEQVL